MFRCARLSMIRVPAAQIEILPIGRFDQFIQCWIIEDRPPGEILRRIILDAGVRGIDPMIGGWRSRLEIIRTHLEAIFPPFAQAGAAAAQEPDGEKSRREAKGAASNCGGAFHGHGPRPEE